MVGVDLTFLEGLKDIGSLLSLRIRGTEFKLCGWQRVDEVLDPQAVSFWDDLRPERNSTISGATARILDSNKVEAQPRLWNAMVICVQQFPLEVVTVIGVLLHNKFKDGLELFVRCQIWYHLTYEALGLLGADVKEEVTPPLEERF